jgi:dynein heavy chain 2
VVVRVGDKTVDYSSGFRLYLSTRNANIHMPPNARSLVTFINYSVTRSGLESKLLSLVINHEQPDLEKRKSELLAG